MAALGVTTEDQLIAVATDPDRTIEDLAKACSALGLMRSRSAIAPLLNIGIRSSDLVLEWESFCALGMIGSTRATRPLLNLIRRDVSAQKKRAVDFALLLLHDKRFA